VFRIEKDLPFEAAHRLPHHDGKCARLHGHSWKATMIYTGPHLHDGGPQDGMLYDFGRLKEAARDLLDNYLDHHDLNATTLLPSPTSEALAKFIWEYMATKRVFLAAVVVQETCTARARYEPFSDPASIPTKASHDA